MTKTKTQVYLSSYSGVSFNLMSSPHTVLLLTPLIYWHSSCPLKWVCIFLRVFVHAVPLPSLYHPGQQLSCLVSASSGITLKLSKDFLKGTPFFFHFVFIVCVVFIGFDFNYLFLKVCTISYFVCPSATSLLDVFWSWGHAWFYFLAQLSSNLLSSCLQLPMV